MRDTIIYSVGDRVQLHPATDAWMSGDRYGTIERVAKPRSTPRGIVRPVLVRCDRSGRLRTLHPDNVMPLEASRRAVEGSIMNTPVVGYLTESGEPVCLACVDVAPLHHKTVERAEPIVDPAPLGIYRSGKNSHLYDHACYLCGWSIRRTSK